MIWRIRQRLGGILLIYIASSVYAISNDSVIIQQIPETYANISGENARWDSLLTDCRRPTLSCIQNKIYRYLDYWLEHTKTFQIGGGLIKVIQNSVHYDDESQKFNEVNTSEYEEAMTEKNATIPNSLREKAAKFLLTHDVQIELPEMLFAGSTLQLTPKKFEKEGFVAQLRLMPKIGGPNGAPRIFLKKIKKFFGDKLLKALLALLLVIVLLVVKFLFFLPLVLGVAAAKKLLLKLLLFVFPFLSHIFKLCPYYEQFGGTKYHHHHHQIAHLHHLKPGPFYIPQHGVDFRPNLYDQDPTSQFDVGVDYGAGPNFGNEFFHNRKTDPKRPKISSGETNQLNSWFGGGQAQDTTNYGRKPQKNRRLTPEEIEKLALKAEKEAVLKVRLQQEHQRVQAENKLLEEQIKQSLKMQTILQQSMLMQQQKRPADEVDLTMDPRMPSQVLRTPPMKQVFPLKPNYLSLASLASQYHKAIEPSMKSQPLPVQSYQLPTQQTSTVEAADEGLSLQMAEAITYDAFYSPILEKIDKILAEIGFVDEACNERLICSMYKNPTKFSPHSNLVSAELSRDASELQKPTATNVAVIKFYRYVQAARDGQDKRDCLRLYPMCSINTEL